MAGGLPDVYGSLLARQLGLEYVHEGAGGGSNLRIWRRLYQHMTTDIAPKDIVIVQYTTQERCEFYSARPALSGYNRPLEPLEQPPFDEPFHDGCVLRYKYGAGSWQNTDHDRQFFREYERRHVSPAWAEQQFAVNHWLLQGRLIQTDQRVIFLKNRMCPRFDLETPLDRYSYTEPWDLLQQPQHRYQPDDTAHMNLAGHQVLARLLESHVRSLGWF